MSDPNPSQILFVPPLRSFIEEVRNLSSDDFERRVIPMHVALTSSTTSNTKTYQVPATHKMAILGVRPHVAVIGAAASETEPMTAFATQHALNRLLTKAMNCRITLINVTTSAKLLGENQALSLATLVNEFGGYLDWRGAPHIVAGGVSLELTATLIQASAPYVGIDTEYGVTLDAVLVRHHGTGR